MSVFASSRFPTGYSARKARTTWYFGQTAEGRDSSAARTYGKSASQDNLNLGLIRTSKVPLPPLAEQYLIVAKVEALMALCDRLEASLAAGDDARRRLLASVLHHALRPDEAPAPALELAG